MKALFCYLLTSNFPMKLDFWDILNFFSIKETNMVSRFSKFLLLDHNRKINVGSLLVVCGFGELSCSSSLSGSLGVTLNELLTFYQSLQ